MLASALLPVEYQQWNKDHGAPYGFRPKADLQRFASDDEWAKMVGPFGVERTHATRTFEYPWLYHTLDHSDSRQILAIGANYSGLLFTLSKKGHRVFNVDPWPASESRIAILNKRYGTDVKYAFGSLEATNLPSNSFDCCYSISVIEHLPEAERAVLLKEIRRVLKPGANLILTVDLFLNLAPFTERKANEFGANINVAAFIHDSGFVLATGTRTELYGFPEFSAERIQAQLERYFMGSYPVLVQCLILRKVD